MDITDVIYQKDGPIAIVTLNRPERLNALGGRLREDLHTALKAADADPEVRTVILTGVGRGFSAGLDLKERGERGPRPSAGYLVGPQTAHLMLRMDKPIIAAVNGPAVGWGFELAMLCDYRIGSDQARMGDRHVKLGIVQDWGAAITLPRVIGWSRAIEFLLTGEMFDARQLLELGILNKVVPAASLMEEALAFARRIACNGPLAVQMTKRLMRNGLRSDPAEALDYSMLMMGMMMATQDAREGFSAQAEKRQPDFKGR